MPAYVVAQVKVKDPEKMAAYAKAAGPTLAAFGAEIIMRAPVLETLAGDADFDRCVMTKFTDVETARAWYNSEAYQEAIKLRDEATERVVFTLVESDD